MVVFDGLAILWRVADVPRGPGRLFLSISGPTLGSAVRQQTRLPRGVPWAWWLRSHFMQKETKTVWPLSQASFARLLQVLLHRLHLGNLHLTPGSVRPGGTTEKFLAGETVERLQLMGRWMSAASLRTYVQEAMSALAWMNVSSSLRHTFSDRLAQYNALIAGPPPKTVFEWN